MYSSGFYFLFPWIFKRVGRGRDKRWTEDCKLCTVQGTWEIIASRLRKEAEKERSCPGEMSIINERQGLPRGSLQIQHTRSIKVTEDGNENDNQPHQHNTASGQGDKVPGVAAICCWCEGQLQI